MRIGFLFYGDINAISGGYLYNRKLIKFLNNNGHEVILISLNQYPYWKCISDNFRGSTYNSVVSYDIDLLLEDAMVHPSVFLLNKKISRYKKVPIISLIHLLNSFEEHRCYVSWLYKRIEYWYVKSVNGFILNSLTTFNHLNSILNLDPIKCCIAVPAGNNLYSTPMSLVDIEQRSSQAQFRILLVGNVIKRKGIHILLKAIQEIQACDISVTVVGRLDMEPEYVDDIQQQINAAKLQQIFRLVGVLEGEELAAVYRQHHVMVLPSVYESYGIVYVEAQQFGLPVIGTRESAAAEIITDSENGFLIQKNDHRQLARFLIDLYHNREKLRLMSLNALSYYHKHPKWDDSFQLIEDYLHTVTQQRELFILSRFSSSFSQSIS